MIEKYQIKKENQEEVLYIYLNYNYEFGKINIFDNIEKYLTKHKIKFNGKKIVFVASGIIFASIILTKPIPEQKELKEEIPKYVSSIILEDFNEELKNIGNKTYEIKEEIKETKPAVDKKTPSKKPTSDKTTKPASTKKPTQNTSSNTNKNTTKPNNQTNTTKPTPKPTTPSKNPTTTPPEENKTYVTVYRSNGKVEKIELETYIIGVVAGEMPASFSTEALKAQSILARTYALKSIKNGKKLTDTTSTQVYKDNSQLKKLWGNSYNTYYNKIKSAVTATKGKTVKYNGDYIEALYHSTSNGYTEDSKNVWGNAYPYLVSVESPYDKNVTGYQKDKTFTYDDVSKKLGITITKDSVIEYEKNKSGRVSILTIDAKQIKGIDVRTKLGLRSTDFVLKLTDNNIKITTKGFGHGVGMSQYGANEMAKRGKSYKEIINHYYKGVTISN